MCAGQNHTFAVWYRLKTLSRPQLSAFNDANAATRSAHWRRRHYYEPTASKQASSGPGCHNQQIFREKVTTNTSMAQHPGLGWARNPLTVGPKCTRWGRPWLSSFVLSFRSGPRQPANSALSLLFLSFSKKMIDSTPPGVELETIVASDLAASFS